MDLDYRSASEDEFDLLAEIRLESMRESLQRIGRFNRERSITRFRESFLATETAKIFQDGQLVGFFAVSDKPHYVRLSHLYLLPHYQARGIGSRVVNKLLHDSDCRGRPVRVTALRGSRSNDFYRKHGFLLLSEEEWDLHYERPAGVAR